EEKHDARPVTELPRRRHDLVEAMRQAEVARVHRDELAREPKCLAEGMLRAGAGVDLIALAPDGNRDDPIWADLLGSDPVGHVGTKPHDLVRAAVNGIAQPGDCRHPETLP